MPWPCFVITPTDQARRSARRFTFFAEAPCPLGEHGVGHEASILLEDAPVVLTPEGYIDAITLPEDDPVWLRIAACRCGYPFLPADPRQVNQDRYYVDAVGSRYLIRRGGGTNVLRLPPGAMWEAPWSRGVDWCGADGKSWIIRLPDGTDWNMDGPASDGGGWTRTGEPPHFTVTPSILSRGYHGWLRSGVLTDDVEGRTYEQ